LPTEKLQNKQRYEKEDVSVHADNSSDDNPDGLFAGQFGRLLQQLG
jgi:hypothetical protein